MKRRTLILLLGGASSGAMSVGTGAFSSVSAEREVSVNVVEDENAYLGIAVDEKANAVQIKNQFADHLDLTVALNSADGVIDEIEAEGPITFVDETSRERDIDVDDESGQGKLGPGNEAHVRIDFGEAGEGSFVLTFTGEAGGASVDKTREFTFRPRDVTGQVTKIKFPGNDKLRILTGDSNGNSGIDGVARVKLYSEDDNGTVTSSDEFEYVPVNTNLRVGDFAGERTGSIAGIEVEGIDGVFEKPDSPGNGSGSTVD